MSELGHGGLVGDRVDRHEPTCVVVVAEVGVGSRALGGVAKRGVEG